MTDNTKTVPANSIVLNPDSGIVWEFLNNHKPDDDPGFRQGCPTGYRLAQEIRQQLPKPKPAEPQNFGAVVKDRDGVLWARADSDDVAWHSNDGSWMRWHQIDAVEVLSEGVAS